METRAASRPPREAASLLTPAVKPPRGARLRPRNFLKISLENQGGLPDVLPVIRKTQLDPKAPALPDTWAANHRSARRGSCDSCFFPENSIQSTKKHPLL